MTAVTPSTFMGMGLGLPSLIASSTARPIAAKRPSTTPSAAAASTSDSRRGVRGSSGWNRWPNPGKYLTPASRWRCSTTRAASSRSPDALELGVDLEVQLHALLARAAVDVVEHVDRRGHRAVDGHAAGRRHPRDRDRRGLGPMVDGRHESPPRSSAACARDGSSPRSMSQMVSTKPTLPMSSWIGIAAQRDLSGADVDDVGLPPSPGFVDELLATLRSSARSPHRGRWACSRRAASVASADSSAAS